MLQQATAQPIPGIGVQFWRFTKPRVVSPAQIMVFHAIIPALVSFVNIAYEILSNQPGPPLWP
jgi:hypothetical protein